MKTITYFMHCYAGKYVIKRLFWYHRQTKCFNFGLGKLGNVMVKVIESHGILKSSKSTNPAPVIQTYMFSVISHLKRWNFAGLLKWRFSFQCWCRFLILATCNFDLFEFSAAILEKGLFREPHPDPAKFSPPKKIDQPSWTCNRVLTF